MNEETIFHHARQRSAGERTAFLERACDGDADLRHRVDALLDAHDGGDGFLGQLPVGLAAAADEQLGGIARLPHGGPDARAAGAGYPEEGSGTRIGPYTLREQIGEGGMGAVFLADQTHPVRRTVALKVVKPGMDSRQVIARFGAERQALALMDHPNIARVIDAGTTDAGRPYFVMELVEGEPLTRYCDAHRLTPRERLELFLPVCRAIQHAHQKGVIHRDLKPSNVLVASYDGWPVPKVIDFGIAKATAHSPAGGATFTELGSVVGTVEYMSPEQAGLGGLDVDTRSDVYSLGVILFELLTGTTPLEPGRRKTAALLEALRLVREEEAPRPSTRLSAPALPPSVAASRGLEPKKLAGVVRGELDWIVMRALEKDRARRYDTAGGLARDVERYLRDEPVQAGPASARYQLRKYVRRHKGPVLAASLVVLALFGGVAATAWQAVRADRARAMAVRERDEKQLALEAETAAREQAMAAREHAMAALHSLTDHVVGWQLARQPTPGGSEQLFLGKILAHFEEFAALPGNVPQNRFIRAEGHLRVGFLQATTRDNERAGASFGLAISMFQALSDDFPDVLDHRRYLALSKVALGNLHADTGKPEEAMAQFRQAAAIRKQLPAPAPGAPDYRRYLVRDQGSLMRLLDRAGRLTQAETEQRLVVGLREELAEDFPDVTQHVVDMGNSYRGLAMLVGDAGRPDEALEWYGKAIGTLTPAVGRQPRLADARLYLCNSHYVRAGLLELRGRFAEALLDWERAVELEEGARRPDFEMRRLMCLARVRPAEAVKIARGLIACGPDDLENTSRWVPILLLAGDAGGYRQSCAQHLDHADRLKCLHLPGRKNFLLARLCLLDPGADPVEPSRRAGLALDAERRAWYLHAVGLAHYRARRYDDAVKRLEEASRADDKWAAQPVNSLVLALAYHRAGRAGQAGRTLRAVTAQMEGHRNQRVPGMGMHAHDLLAWQLLRREAEALMPAAAGR